MLKPRIFMSPKAVKYEVTPYQRPNVIQMFLFFWYTLLRETFTGTEVASDFDRLMKAN